MKVALALVLALCIGYYAAGKLYPQEMYDGAMGLEANLSQLQEKQLAIGIGNISYYENAQSPDSKPSVLMVHGFGAYKENWLRFAREFKEDFHVVVIDLPGHGKSVNEIELNYSLPNQVNWINEFMAALDIKQFHMVGNSMGGAITALYAAQFPSQVLTATLIDPAGIHTHRSVMHELLDQGINPLVAEDYEGFKRLMDFAMEQSPFVPWPITEVSAWRAKALKPVHDKLWVDMMAHQNEYFLEKIQTITVPVSVQWGDQDRVLNYKNMEIFAELIPNAKTHLWENIGHVPMVEIPKESAQLMLANME